MSLHQHQRLAHLIIGPYRDQLPAGQLAHRQLVQRSTIQNGPLQPAGGEDAPAWWLYHIVTYQHVAGLLGLKQPHHRNDVHVGRYGMRWAQQRLVHPGHVQRLHLPLGIPPGHRLHLLSECREQQRTEGVVGRNQRVHCLMGQLVGQHLIHRHETAARTPGHQRPSVEAVVRPIGGQQLAAIELLHIALDQHEQVLRHIAGIQQHLAGPEVRHVHLVTDQPLLRCVQAVEGRDREIEGIRHGTPSLSKIKVN